MYEGDHPGQRPITYADLERAKQEGTAPPLQCQEIEMEHIAYLTPEGRGEPADKALHYSTGKPGVDQLPPEILEEWGAVYTYGEQKYFRNNWMRGNEWHEFYGSLLRHALAFWKGEDIDPESGQSHLAHVIWNAAAIRYFQLHGLGSDDRPHTVRPVPIIEENDNGRPS